MNDINQEVNRVAFFWIGESIEIPLCLVKSLQLTNKDLEIIQLTDNETPAIAGTSKIIRNYLSKDIMTARLQSYASLETTQSYTFFCDADSIFINTLKIENSENILLSPRKLNFIINHNFPEFYPEFTGKMINQVMPYLFGAIALKNDNDFFKELLGICDTLPQRFHRWYGDQYSLAIAIKQKRLKFGLLNPDIHLNIQNEAPTINELKTLVKNNVQMITFKGPSSNKSANLPLTMERLKAIY
jgi:hypothetical protein